MDHDPYDMELLDSFAKVVLAALAIAVLIGAIGLAVVIW